MGDSERGTAERGMQRLVPARTRMRPANLFSRSCTVYMETIVLEIPCDMEGRSYCAGKFQNGAHCRPTAITELACMTIAINNRNNNTQDCGFPLQW
jgi:hypothetical protein